MQIEFILRTINQHRKCCKLFCYAKCFIILFLAKKKGYKFERIHTKMKLLITCCGRNFFNRKLWHIKTNSDMTHGTEVEDVCWFCIQDNSGEGTHIKQVTIVCGDLIFLD